MLTLPVIPVALVYAASGANPLVGDGAACSAVIAAVAIPAVLFLPSIPFGAGAFGIGDVKLLVGVGLLVGGEPGVERRGVRAACCPASCCVVLLAARRIGRRTLRAVRAVLHRRGALGGADPRLGR